MRYLALFILCFGVMSSPHLYAEQQTEETRVAQELESWQHFKILVNTISTMRDNLEVLQKELEETPSEIEQERLRTEIRQINQDLQSLNTALEMLATGGADLSLFGVKVDEPFDLREELQSIFEPIVVELRRLSERPRKIERLRSDQLYYEQRLEVASEALDNLRSYRKNAPSEALRKALQRLEDRWQRRKDDLQNRVNLVKFELDQLLSPDKSSQKDTWESLKNLFGGRLLNLAMGILVMIITYAFLNLLAKLYRRFIMRDATRRKAFIARVGSLAFYVTTTLIVLISGMAVFYVRGDWVLLGLFLIILAGAAWAIQKSLPRFLTEAKLILNLGPVREGERIIFNDLPWQVTSLNFQASLSNPLLQGGRLQIPIRELVSYNSRRFDKEEPWFPSRKGDWVTLSDGTYGQVKKQSPEMVELMVFDGCKTYPVQQYLNSNPYNLSHQGFTLYVEFGVDYQHQADSTTVIPELLANDLKSGLEQLPVGNHFRSFNLSFSKADSSSLNYVAIVGFDGKAAEYFLQIPRDIQRLAVDSCNRHGWVIPFTQITVHNTNS